MRKSRRLFVAAAVTALVAGGGLGVGLSLVANANTKAPCDSTTTAPITCTLPNSVNTDTTINTPSAIQAVVNLTKGDGASPADQFVQIVYSVYCSLGGQSTTTSNPTNDPYEAITTTTSVTVTLTLGYTNPDSCTVTNLTATLYKNTGTSTAPVYSTATTGVFTMFLEWTPAAGTTATASPSTSTTAPPPPVHVSLVRGYGGKCVDDRGNSSANRAVLIIWSCNSGDKAQGFTFSGGQLKHNGKCVNDAGNGGSGTHVILWTCNGGSNEKWFHSSSDGEFVLNSTRHGFLCLTDPGNSKTNGTRLVVYTCHNTSNQHWT